MACIWKLDKKVDFCNRMEPNEGFTVKIANAPGYGASGRMSTMGCYVTKGTDTDVVQLDSNILVELIKRKTVVNGVFEGTYSIASIGGCKCIINDTMPEWEQAQQDMAIKGMKKTKKYVVGRNYKTISIDELYLGEIYKVYSMTYINKVGTDGKNYNHLVLKKLEEKEKHYMMLDVDANGYYKKRDLYRACRSVKEYINLMKSLIAQGVMEESQFIKFVANKPARAEGELRLLDNATDEDWKDFFRFILEHLENGKISMYKIKYDDSILCYSIDGTLVDYSEYTNLLGKNKLEIVSDNS